MSKKLYGAGDLVVLRNQAIRGIWITPQEFREVVGLVGEVSYALYSLLRTYPFKEAEEITDVYLSELTGWKASKVKRARLQLESKGLYMTLRYGTKAEGVTKMFVGLEPVALHNAGLPADIINSSAHTKLKKKFGITDTQELVKQADLLAMEYHNNPSEYGK